MDIIVFSESEVEQFSRSVTLSNDEWMVLAQCVEAFSETYRGRHSQTVATLVTRGQLPEAVEEAQKMNLLLQKLDQIQAKLL